MDECNHVLQFPALLNVRDLGGHPTLDGCLTRPRSLIRADDLAQLTPEGLRALADYGIETVLDLRWPAEVAAYPSPVTRLAGVRYQAISLLAQDPARWWELGGDCAKERWNRAVLEHLQPQLREALGLIAAATAGPLLFHCVAGKDRTGVIAALLLTLAGVRPDVIAADYSASGENLRKAYLCRYPDSDPAAIAETVRCPEQAVYNMLEYLDSVGGVRAFLARIGLSSRQIERLRQRLRAE